MKERGGAGVKLYERREDKVTYIFNKGDLLHKLPFKSLGSVRFLMSLKEIAFEHLFDKKI